MREYQYENYFRKILHKLKLFHFRKIQKGRFHPIFITTLPKSGSVYLLTRMTKGLRIHSTRISAAYFPLDIIDVERLEQFIKGQFVAHAHVPPSDLNIRIINSVLDRLWLHVRDPRQALISMVHHLDRTTKDLRPPQLAAGVAAFYGIKDWYALTFEQKVDALIDGYYPDLIRFIEGWLDCEKRFTRTRMLVTSQEELKRSEPALLERVFDFYEIPRDIFEMVVLKRDMALTHFRKGEAKEWAAVMTEAQKARVNAALPKALAERFGW